MKKLVCLALALFMMLSCAACTNTDTDKLASTSGFTDSETHTEPQGKPSSKDESSANSKSPSAPTAPNNHKHQYVKTEKTATCGETGGTLYSCACGEGYVENAVDPSYKHDFEEHVITIGESSKTIFKCTNCETQALYIDDWWKYKKKFNEVRWYVLGKISPSSDGKRYIESDYEIIICGVGEIESFNEKNGSAPWRRFLGSKLKAITVTNGVTSIGENAFSYRVAGKREVSFNISGTVKTIKSGAIKLGINEVVLGSGIETVEANAIDGVSEVYLPKSIKTYCDLGRRTNVRYYYEGNIDDLYKVTVENSALAGNPQCTFKERCEWSDINSETPAYSCAIILSSSKMGKGNAVFDGKTVKTDAESLKPYIKSLDIH